MTRWFRALLLLCCVALASFGRSAAADAIELAPVPEAGAVPGDAPKLGEHELELPAIPSGYVTYEGGWIRFSYAPPIRRRLQPLIERADRLKAELSERFGVPVLDAVDVRVARTLDEMETLAPVAAPYPEYASGVAYADLDLVLLSVEAERPGTARELEEVFVHELAHIALDDALNGYRVPRWFNEGLAIHLSGEATLARMRTLSTAALAGDLLPLSDLKRSFPSDLVATPIAYAQSADVVRFLLRQETRERFKQLTSRMRKGQPFETALQDAYGFDLASLEYEWRREVARRYSFWPALLGGGVIWIVALGLATWAWRRKRNQQRETLKRWAKEEALEDQLRKARVLPGRIHIVLRDGGDDRARVVFEPTPQRVDGEIPKVAHEGSWHTLH